MTIRLRRHALDRDRGRDHPGDHDVSLVVGGARVGVGARVAAAAPAAAASEPATAASSAARALALPAGAAVAQPGAHDARRRWCGSRATSRSSARSRPTRITSRWSARWSRAASRAWRAGVGDQLRRGQILGEIESAEVGRGARGADRGAKRALHRRRGQPAPRDRPGRAAHLVVARARAGAGAVGRRQGRRARGAPSACARSACRTPTSTRSITATSAGACRCARRSTARCIERTITLGQAVERATDAFKIADLVAPVGEPRALREGSVARARRPGGRGARRRVPGRDLPRPRRLRRAGDRRGDAHGEGAPRVREPRGPAVAGPARHRAHHRRRPSRRRPRCWPFRATPSSASRAARSSSSPTAPAASEQRAVELGGVGRRARRDPRRARRGRGRRRRRRVPAEERAACDEPGRRSSTSRCAAAAWCWSSGRRCCWPRSAPSASCRSTPSPTSPTPRSRC